MTTFQKERELGKDPQKNIYDPIELKMNTKNFSADTDLRNYCDHLKYYGKLVNIITNEHI
jgi:hypothetical protein